MSLKDHLYYLTEEDGRSLTVINNIITAIGAKTPVVNTPNGWQEIGVKWERIMKYHGLNRNVSSALEFYRQEAYILRNETLNRNIERKIFLIIQYLTLEYDPSYYKFLYKYLYKGELDLSTFKSDIDRVTVQISEGGLQKQFKANETTTYSLPFENDLDTKYLYMDGIKLSGVYRWILPGNPAIVTGAYVGMYQLPGEATIPGLAVFTVNEALDTSVPDADNLNYFAEATQDIAAINISSTIKNLNQLAAAGPLEIRFFVFNTVSNTLRVNMDLTPTDPYPENYDLPVDIDIDLLEGDRLFLRRGSVFSESELTLSGSSKYIGTTIPFFLPFDAYKKLVGKITGDETNAQSTLLQTTYKDYAITCGDAIRGLAGATIKTSIGQFFEDYDVTCFAGLSIDNGKIKMEDRVSFYDPSNPIDLGDAKNHEFSYAKDLVGSKLRVGHIKPDIEDINGRFDPNGSSLFTLPITRVAKEVTIVGPYKKGPYEIETTRLNLDGKTTTDNNNDNDVFVIHVKKVDPATVVVSFSGSSMVTPLGVDLKTGMRIVITGSAAGNDTDYIIQSVEIGGSSQNINLNKPVTAESNVSVQIEFPYILNRDAVVDNDPDVCPSPETIFNVVFSPKNILNVHDRWLRSILTGFDAEKVKYQSSDKNSRFLATVNGDLIDEDIDVDISNMGDRLFLNYYHEIETLVPVDLVELLETNPNRCFKFRDIELDQEFLGFNIDAGLAVNTQSPQQFKLLSSPSNDLSKLIF